jgi:uncharacterized DUF497 family protein
MSGDDAREEALAETGRDLEFEWDEGKRKANIEKHGIDFSTARRVFHDPAAVMMEGSHRSGERRLLMVGRLDEVLVTVVYTLREERLRIISARRARRSERKQYGQ